MAITKIHALQASIRRAVNYICNPDKTDGEMLVTSFGTSPKTAEYDFKFALSKTNRSDPNKGYHLIQSFAPGEISYEDAHTIGLELADRLLEGRFSYIVATHIDKDHVHNHIIFCAADNIDHVKYHDCKKSYWRLRNMSDKVCGEHGLSIIPRSANRGKSYGKWKADKAKASREIATNPLVSKNPEKTATAFPKKKKSVIQDYSKKTLIDTSTEKFINSPGLTHWADIQNLKTAAAIYNSSGSVSELKDAATAKSAELKKAREDLVALERQIKEQAEILKYAQQYKENRIYNVRYKRSKDPDRYLREHETQLILYDGAKSMLQRLGLRPSKDLDVDTIRCDYDSLIARKNDLQNKYRSLEKENRALSKKLDTITHYLETEKTPGSRTDRPSGTPYL